MRTRVKIVVEVQAKNAQQVSLVEYDEVVEAFTANRSNQALTIRILPGRSGGANDLLDAQISNALLQYVAIDGVAITDQESGRCLIKKCLDDLLCRPVSRRVGCDVVMDDVTAVVAHDHEGEEYTVCSGRDGEEIDRNDVGQMIVQECPPSL